MKKILIFSTAYFPFVGGAEIAIKEITDRLNDDFEFHLITGKFNSKLPSQEKIGAVVVHRIGIGFPLFDKLWLPWGGALYTHKLHKQYLFDLFWPVMATFASGAAYIASFFIKPKIPIILTLQEGDSENYLKFKWAGLIDLSWRLALWKANFLTVISTYLGKRARRLGYEGALEIIPNGVNTKIFAGEKVQHEGTILITTSRLVHKNAVDVVIKALSKIPNIRFKILGIGPEEQNLKELAKKEKVQDRVEFIGHVGHKDMPKYLKASDIFIRASRSEGMGNSFIEAMAAELPVIATQEGGIADFLFDKKRNPDMPTTGWAVDKDSPEQIIEAVKNILSNKNQTQKVIETAKKLAFEKYDWDLIARSMKDKVFDKVLEK